MLFRPWPNRNATKANARTLHPTDENRRRRIRNAALGWLGLRGIVARRLLDVSFRFFDRCSQSFVFAGCAVVSPVRCWSELCCRWTQNVAQPNRARIVENRKLALDFVTNSSRGSDHEHIRHGDVTIWVRTAEHPPSRNVRHHHQHRTASQNGNDQTQAASLPHYIQFGAVARAGAFVPSHPLSGRVFSRGAGAANRADRGPGPGVVPE